MRSGIFIILSIFVLALVSCDQDPDCNQNTIAGVKFTFKKNIHTDTILVYDSLLMDYKDTIVDIERPPSSTSPVWFHSAGSSQDTAYSTGKDMLQVLPLTAGLTSQRYILNYGEENDVIEFYYNDELTFVDIPCGFIANFYIDSIYYTKHIIDSITFLSPDADNDVSTENITIYYY